MNRVRISPILAFGVILSLISYPVPNLRIFWGGTGIPITVLFLPLLVLAMVADLSTGTPMRVPRWLYVATGLMLLSCFTSALSYGEVDFGTSFRLIAFLLIPTMFFQAIQLERERRAALTILLAVGVVLCLYGFYGYFTGRVGQETQMEWWSSYARYYGIHYLQSTRNSDFYFIAVPFLIASIRGVLSEAFWPRMAYVASSFLLLTAVILTFSRGGWLALTAAIGIISFLMLPGAGLKTIIRAGAFVVLGLLIGRMALTALDLDRYFLGKTFSIIGAGVNPYLIEVTSNRERLDLIKASIDVSGRHPLGVGPGNLRHQLHRRHLPQNHPENSYLNILAENGFIGLAGFLIFILAPIHALGRRMKLKKLRGDHVVGFSIAVFMAISYLFNTEVYNLYNWIIHASVWAIVGADNGTA